jgi:hypothetical protein
VSNASLAAAVKSTVENYFTQANRFGPSSSNPAALSAEEIQALPSRVTTGLQELESTYQPAPGAEGVLKLSVPGGAPFYAAYVGADDGLGFKAYTMGGKPIASELFD